MPLTNRMVVVIVAIPFDGEEVSEVSNVVPDEPSMALRVFLKVENCSCNPKWRIYSKLLCK